MFHARGMVWLVSANYRGPVPGRLGIPPTCGGAFWGNLPPPKPQHTSFRLRNFSTLGQLWWQKKPPAVVLSKQLKTIFCIVVCFFVSFFLSFFVYLSFFGFHLLLLGINNVSSHSSRFFLVEFPVRKIYAIEKLTGLGKFLQTTSFKWMDGTKSWLERVYRDFTTQLYRD